MFRSFYLAGFECATGYNMHGEWIDQIAATQHDLHVDEDYARLAELDIHAVREAIRWPLVDRAGSYDFSSVDAFVAASRHHHFDVIWDLFHYGYPGDVDLFSEAFIERFAAYCRACARYLCERTPGPHFFTPINEPSYFSWAAGDAARFAPHKRGQASALKVQFARATIAAVGAIRRECPDARIVNVDPICWVVPKSDDAEELERVRSFNQGAVYEFWDMVSGRLRPELGGRPEYLDVVGLNYYWTNQWELGTENTPLASDDPRRVPLGALVRQAFDRYGTDVVITETSALGDARGPWLHELSAMAESLLEQGVKLGGLCLYPILGMPEWHDRAQWTRMGLWDLEHEQEVLQRKLHPSTFEALRAAQRRELASGRARQRRFTLTRTHNVPLVVHGLLAAHVHDVAHGYDLRLIRCDAPHRLWVASIAVTTGNRLLRHVSTAAELPVLVESLRRLSPRAVQDAYGAELTATPGAEEAWARDVESLLVRRDQFEQVQPLDAYPVETPRSAMRR